MKKFLVKVNGVQYEVEVEEVKENLDTSISSATKPDENKPETNYEKNQEPSSTVPDEIINSDKTGQESNVKVAAQIPGTIIKIGVSVGDTVEKGDLLMVIEAMKMENEITSPCAGKIVSINFSEGDIVAVGQTLIELA